MKQIKDNIKILEIQQLDNALYATVIEDETHRSLIITSDQTNQGLIQGRMKLTDLVFLESDYMQAMATCLQWPQFKTEQDIAKLKITVMGLGIGALPRYLRYNYPKATIKIVEKYMAIIVLAETHFFGKEAAKQYQYHIGDYQYHLLYKGQNQQPQDLLLVDVFTNKTTIGDMADAGFYHWCQRWVGDKGVLAINLVGDPESISRCFESAGEVFDYVYQRDVRHGHNTILIASNTPAPEESKLQPIYEGEGNKNEQIVFRTISRVGRTERCKLELQFYGLGRTKG